MANIFPKWVNKMPLRIVVALVVISSVVTGLVTYYATPKYTRVGYAPIQPVPFSHAIHVDQLGLDCRYCHTYVDRSGHSNIPTAATCMNCHTQIGKEKPDLEPVRRCYESGEPIPWIRIHQLPDYVYFNHSAHVNRGISCLHCHGEINKMDVVAHAKPLSMSFCLDCHREPYKHIRPVDKVYDLEWSYPDTLTQITEGKKLVESWQVHPPQGCSCCHR